MLLIIISLLTFSFFYALNQVLLEKGYYCDCSGNECTETEVISWKSFVNPVMRLCAILLGIILADHISSFLNGLFVTGWISIAHIILSDMIKNRLLGNKLFFMPLDENTFLDRIDFSAKFIFLLALSILIFAEKWYS